MKEYQKSPLATQIGLDIRAELAKRRITIDALSVQVAPKVSLRSIKSILQGFAGTRISTIEPILDALGLTLIVVPKKHPDLLD